MSDFGSSFSFFYFAMKKGELLSDADGQQEVERERKKLEDSSVKSTVYLVEDDSTDFLGGMDLWQDEVETVSF